MQAIFTHRAMAGLVCGLLLSHPLAAAEWSTRARLQQQLGYNDNMRLMTRDPEAVWSYTLEPALEMQRKNRDSDLEIKAGADIRRNDDPRWDCDNFNLQTRNEYRSGRMGAGFSGGYTGSCTYLQQLIDTGLLQPRVDYRQLQLTPSWFWQWGPRDKLTAETGYARTEYDRNPGDPSTAFIGNETWSFALDEGHQWSPRLALDGRLIVTTLRYADRTLPDQSVQGVQLGGHYQLDRTLKISLDAGPRRIQTRSAPGSDGSVRWGHSLNLAIDHETLLHRVTARYSSTIAPSSIGQALQYQTLSSRYQYRIDPAWSLQLEAGYYRTASLDGPSPANAFNRDYVAVSAGLRWHLTRELDLTLDYGYRFQQYDDFPGQAHGNSLLLGLGYGYDLWRDGF
jgi:hypothetical protein